MSAVEDATMAPIQNHVDLHNRQRRRNGKGDIFEHVDVPLLMKKLNVEDSTRTSCSSCPRPCAGDGGGCPLISTSSSSGDTSADTGLEKEEEDSTSSSSSSGSCDRLKESDLLQCSSSGTKKRCFQGSNATTTTTTSSSSSCGFLKAESEAEKMAADYADNSHAVLAIRPEVCAKRSLIF